MSTGQRPGSHSVGHSPEVIIRWTLCIRLALCQWSGSRLHSQLGKTCNGTSIGRSAQASGACRWCPLVTAGGPGVGPVQGPERATHHKSLAGCRLHLNIGSAVGQPGYEFLFLGVTVEAEVRARGNHQFGVWNVVGQPPTM
jgi:hypothetical protein